MDNSKNAEDVVRETIKEELWRQELAKISTINIEGEKYDLIEGKKYIRNNVYSFEVSVLRLKKTGDLYVELFKEDDYNGRNQVITVPITMFAKILPDIIDKVHTYSLPSVKDKFDAVKVLKERTELLQSKHPSNKAEEIEKTMEAFLECCTTHAINNRNT